MPAATAAAAPPLDPPGVCSGSHGFRVGPYASGSVTGRLPNSGLLRTSERDQAGVAEVHDEVRIVRRQRRVVARRAVARRQRQPGDMIAEVLQEERHAGERSLAMVGRQRQFVERLGLVAGTLEPPHDHGVDRPVELLRSDRSRRRPSSVDVASRVEISSACAVASSQRVSSALFPMPTCYHAGRGARAPQTVSRLAILRNSHEPTATTMIAPMIAPTMPPQSNLSSSPMPNRPVKIQ